MSEKAVLVSFSNLVAGHESVAHNLRLAAQDLPAFKLAADKQRFTHFGVIAADNHEQEVRFTLYDALARYTTITRRYQEMILQGVRKESEQNQCALVIVKDFPWAKDEVRTWCFTIQGPSIAVSVL